MRKFLLASLMVLVCLTTALSQSRNQTTTQEKRALLLQMARDTTQLNDAIYHSLGGFKGALKDMRVKKTDLNRDGQPDYIIDIRDAEWGMCTKGNCLRWVYRKSGNGYKSLLSTTSVALSMERSSTNGYRDLRSSHDADGEPQVSIYKYDGSQYQESQCYTGKYVGKRLKLTPMKCEKTG
ncbi:MAG: hypothetical protein QOJ02_3227 [Acidobacteriota bacterium]|jgi:hypothetical protein|nr:hypothetical protein [Acidobacteriota bacterium]